MEELLSANIPSIRMGELRVTGDGVALRTLLGSCVGLALFDRRQKIGGLAHIVLPQSRSQSEGPGKYVDTAVPSLVSEIESLADGPIRLNAKLAGGASMFSTGAKMNIGKLNVEACEVILRKMGIPILARHCGGTQGRKMTLDTRNGNAWIEIVGQDPIEL